VTRKVLIVDDDRLLRENVARILRPLGLEVSQAEDGLEAMELLRSSRPDLLITDIEMPRISGLQLVQWMRRSPELANVLVMILTSRASLDDKLRGLEGADDYITKPFEALELKARVKVMMRLKDALDTAVERQRRLEEITITDDLTGIYNRRFLNARTEEEFAKAVRHRTPLCCLILDLDYFKLVNDNYGHAWGDFVLAEFARIVRSRLRQGDVFARYGGEEFVVLLPLTPWPEGRKLADDLRAQIASHRFVNGGLALGLTVSIGVAAMPNPLINTVADLMAIADQALYRAKQDGRNRVAGPTPEDPP